MENEKNLQESSTSGTKTAVQESNETNTSYDGDLKSLMAEGKYNISAPLFLMFAEYLGYVSKFTEIAMEWCEGKVPEEYIQKILDVEAKSIFRQMKKDYPMEEIQLWYDTYYPVILSDYEEKLDQAYK